MNKHIVTTTRRCNCGRIYQVPVEYKNKVTSCAICHQQAMDALTATKPVHQPTPTLNTRGND